MNKTLLTAFILLPFLMISQSLVVTGDTLVYGLNQDFQIESHLIVKNVSNDTSLVLCEKNVISQSSSGDNAFCWGGTCYGTGTMISTKLDTLDPGEQTNGFTGYFYPSWISQPTGACSSVVEYCFYLQSNPQDETCITVTYNAMEPSSSNIFDVKEGIGNFYPNPASKYTSFSYNVEGFSTFEITDVLGNVIQVIDLIGSGNKTIYLGELKKGVYFGTLVKDGSILNIKKLIINK